MCICMLYIYVSICTIMCIYIHNIHTYIYIYTHILHRIAPPRPWTCRPCALGAAGYACPCPRCPGPRSP